MSERKSILVVEDDPPVMEFLIDTLSAGYDVLPAKTIQEGWALFSQKRPALALLDVSLPDGSGTDMCRRIRAHPERAETPVIILTGRRQMDDKKDGFASGADQYLVKPIESAELLMWVGALLTRVAVDKGELGRLHAGRLVLDPKAMIAAWDGALLTNLTPKEFQLLHYIVRRRPAVVSRREILSRLWHTVAVDNLVDTHMHNLRRKLPQALAVHIQAVPGKGFRYLDSPSQ